MVLCTQFHSCGTKRLQFLLRIFILYEILKNIPHKWSLSCPISDFSFSQLNAHSFTTRHVYVKTLFLMLKREYQLRGAAVQLHVRFLLHLFNNADFKTLKWLEEYAHLLGCYTFCFLCWKPKSDRDSCQCARCGCKFLSLTCTSVPNMYLCRVCK